MTLSEETIAELVTQLKDGKRDLLFTERINRDAVWKAAKAEGLLLRRRSDGPHRLDPRYTVEGHDLPNRGMGNDYKHYHHRLYRLIVS